MKQTMLIDHLQRAGYTVTETDKTINDRNSSIQMFEASYGPDLIVLFAELYDGWVYWEDTNDISGYDPREEFTTSMFENRLQVDEDRLFDKGLHSEMNIT